MTGIVTLIKKECVQTELGPWRETETRFEVYAEFGAITRAEWTAAGNNGLSPSKMFRTAAINYSGEKTAEFDGKRYGIYRTYQAPDSDEIEIYLEEKAGV